jgi:hypothetical protein
LLPGRVANQQIMKVRTFADKFESIMDQKSASATAA